jgi:hypothetical protein
MILNRGGEPVENNPLIPAILIFSDAAQSLNKSDEPAIDEWDLKSELKAMKAKFKADNLDILDDEIHARNCASCFDIPDSENLKYENNLEMQTKLGKDFRMSEKLQHVVFANRWFGAHVLEGDFVLVSCSVSPGFDFSDFELK